MTQLEAQLEGLAIGLEQRDEKSAAHIARLAVKELVALRAALQRIADEPNNTMSNGKAMGEMARIAKAALR